jgi:hypothetical protein
MTRETIRDHIPWDDYYETRDNNEEYKEENLEFLSSPNKKTIHHTKVSSIGVQSLVDKLQDDVTKIDFRLHGIRDEIDELEARSLQNVLTKQSER